MVKNITISIIKKLVNNNKIENMDEMKIAIKPKNKKLCSKL